MKLKIESGKKSLTNYFKNKKFDIFVVNSDGKRFTEELKLSETYMYKGQRKILFVINIQEATMQQTNIKKILL